jgi:NADH dehydrogenase
LWAARSLAPALAEVVLIDQHNYHSFLPLLYQVAAAELEPEAIAFPLRSITRHWPNTRFIQARVTGVDVDAQRVHTRRLSVPYDYLIVAGGSTAHYLGVPGAVEHSFPLKSLDDAIALRNHVLACFERAETLPPGDEQRQALTFVIVGGGPTGVEFAGALIELIRGPLMRDYSLLQRQDVAVTLVEAASHLLPGLPADLQRYAEHRLTRMGVEVRLGAPVRRIGAACITLRDGALIPSLTAVWTAGVRSDPALQRWGLPTGRGGRLAVRPTLQVPGHPEIFVAGDLADVESIRLPLPMTAPVATQQGAWAAHNVKRLLAGKLPEPFQFHDRGTMATIGRNAAVAWLLGLRFTGLAAWLIWLAVHLFNLMGFRNRLLVLLAWAWDYLFTERVVRLILPSEADRSWPGDHTRYRFPAIAPDAAGCSDPTKITQR